MKNKFKPLTSVVVNSYPPLLSVTRRTSALSPIFGRGKALGVLFQIVLTGAVLHLAIVSHAQTSSESQRVVAVPLNDAFTVGEGSQKIFPGDGARFLSIYAPGQFINAMPNGGFITQIAFRLDESLRGSTRTFDLEAEVRMSTSPSLATAVPKLHFSENIGRDESVVYPRNAIHWTSTPNSQGPNPFDLRLTLPTPFFYDPHQGSLAVDLVTFSELETLLLADTAGIDDIGITEVSLAGVLVNDLGDFHDSPVIQLYFLPVPEPSVSILMLAGTLVFLFKHAVS